MNDDILNANSVTISSINSPLYSTISNDSWDYLITGTDNTLNSIYSTYANTISTIEENSNELKINIKKSQIKFNFNL